MPALTHHRESNVGAVWKVNFFTGRSIQRERKMKQNRGLSALLCLFRRSENDAEHNNLKEPFRQTWRCLLQFVEQKKCWITDDILAPAKEEDNTKLEAFASTLIAEDENDGLDPVVFNLGYNCNVIVEVDGDDDNSDNEDTIKDWLPVESSEEFPNVVCRGTGHLKVG